MVCSFLCHAVVAAEDTKPYIAADVGLIGIHRLEQSSLANIIA